MPTSLPRVLGLARGALPVLQLGVRRMKRQKSPFQMTFSLTNRCNFRCEYCDIPLQKREEMTTSEWCDAIDAFWRGGLGRASLIGGEPMLRRDLGEIVRHLKRRGIHVAMNTNGWFVAERFAEIADLDLLCITLDGPREVHDAQRHQGSYDRVLGALELLKQREKPFVTMTVVTPRGSENMRHVLEIAKQYGFRAFFQLEHDKTCDVYAPIAPTLPDTRIAALADELVAYKRAGLPVGNSYSVLETQRRDGRRLGGSCEHCYAGRYFGYVLSDGTVAPCLLTQWQQERANGKTLGFLEAFETMNPPEGPGCACVPIHEVNQILDFKLGVLFDALELVVGPAREHRARV
ncbi:MAG TPA: radical SAM protein [Polyangiaceae bacterium]